MQSITYATLSLLLAHF